jgi:uncharacterized protein YndB with AHSA1/START domain
MLNMQFIDCTSRKGHTMYDIRHRIGVEATTATVYEQVATIDGLRHWWTTDTRGRAAVGERIDFHFGGPDRYMTMEVLELDPAQRVAWRCVAGPDEWLDTTITFDLADTDGETILRFTHAGWREPVDFMGHCSSKWGSYLLSLKHGIEAGAARPFPHDVKMSRFD